MTKLLQCLRDELVRRDYAASTRSYLQIVDAFRQHTGARLDRLTPGPAPTLPPLPPRGAAARRGHRRRGDRRALRLMKLEALRRAYDRHELDLAGGTEHLRDPAQWHAFVDALFETDWVVYAKPAFGGASAVLRYLGRYTHRVAISNHRLLAFDGEHVTFQWKDYAHGDQRRTMTLSAMEFLRRFVQHILPRGFVRIRQSGFLANTCRAARVALARTLLATPSTPAPASTDATATSTTDDRHRAPRGRVRDAARR